MAELTREDAENIRWDVIWIVGVLVVCAALLLPLGRWMLLLRITRSLGVLWGAVLLSSLALHRLLRALKVEDDPPTDPYLLSNAALGVVLLAAWAGHAALLVRGATEGAPVWVMGLVYAAGFLASHAAFTTVSILYRGSFFRMANAPVALGGYLLFSAWPAAARALFGWLG